MPPLRLCLFMYTYGCDTGRGASQILGVKVRMQGWQHMCYTGAKLVPECRYNLNRKP
jgi:hypothetical protein